MRGDGIRLLTGSRIHEEVVRRQMLTARERVWIATANLKDMHVAVPSGFRPVLDFFDRMALNGVRFRIIHSGAPSGEFQESLRRQRPQLRSSLTLHRCPRSHWKMVLVDRRFAYLGSANFTGAGLGVKADRNRNLEVGIGTEDPAWVERVEKLFEDFLRGVHCTDCGRRKDCPSPIR